MNVHQHKNRFIWSWSKKGVLGDQSRKVNISNSSYATVFFHTRGGAMDACYPSCGFCAAIWIRLLHSADAMVASRIYVASNAVLNTLLRQPQAIRPSANTIAVYALPILAQTKSFPR